MNAIYDTALAASMAAVLSANANMASDKTQMRLFLDRLKAVVPKNRKVSRQQLIELVINSISDLQDTQDSDPEDDCYQGSPISDPFSHPAQYGAYSIQPHHICTCQGFNPGAIINSPQTQQGYSYQHHYNFSSNSYNGFSSGHGEEYSSGYNSDGSSCSGYSNGSVYMN